MKVDEVLNCSFSTWYARFKKVTIRSIHIPLPDEFLDYLLSDGVVLPGCVPVSQDDLQDSNGRVNWAEADDDENDAPSFPALQIQVSQAVARLGGRCFPKLNWSSPKDAAWIAINNSPSCTSFEDICLLLKSSDFVVHDLTRPFQNCSDWQDGTQVDGRVKYELVLRKWVEIDPSMEFRCFIGSNSILAISQRDYTTYYQHIEEQQADIVRDIKSFFEEHIQHRFPSNNYVFDVHRQKKDHVVLVDFNPFGETTDPLLFDWEELKALDAEKPDLPDFRYTKENRGVQPSPYRHYGLPRDFIDLCSGEDAQKLIDLLSLRRGEQESSDDERES